MEIEMEAATGRSIWVRAVLGRQWSCMPGACSFRLRLQASLPVSSDRCPIHRMRR